MTSWFVAELDCPECGARTAADTATDMVTSLEPWPQRDVIRAGDEIGLGWPAVAGAYLPIREPGRGEPVRFLQAWWCRECGALRWAEVVLDGGRVASISAVRMEPATLDRAHAIDDRVGEEYFRRTGESLFVGGRARPEFAARLRAALGEG